MTTALAQHIDAASEAVRLANHATMCATLDGPKAYAVVGGLAELVARLPQVLDYLTRSLRRADAAEHYDDRGHDPADGLGFAQDDLDDARAAVDDAARYLSSAHNQLSHLGRHITED